MVVCPCSSEYFSELVVNKIDHLHRTINELTKSLLPFGPRKFAEAAKQIADAIDKSFHETTQSSRASGMPQAAVEKQLIIDCKMYLALLRRIDEELLHYLEEIDGCFIPSELFFSIYDMIERYLGERFSLSFYPLWESGYGLNGRKHLVQTYFSPLSSIPPKGTQEDTEWFLFISYPRMECRNSLLHAAMIHEIAHLVDYKQGIAKSLMDSIELDKQSMKELIQYLSETGSDGSSQQEIEQKAYDDCIEIMRCWVEEIVCDLIAVRIAGPAYFFAFSELSVLADVMGKYSSAHPASAFRMKYSLEELKKMGYRTGVTELSDIFDGWDQEIQGKFSPPNNRYHRVAYRSISKAIPVLQNKVRKCIPGELSYTADRFGAQVPQLAKWLKNGIAPSDIWKNGSKESEPAGFISLLNAGWLVYYSQREDLHSVLKVETALDKSKALDNLNELLLKAIEGSEILRRIQVEKGGDS